MPTNQQRSCPRGHDSTNDVNSAYDPESPPIFVLHVSSNLCIRSAVCLEWPCLITITVPDHASRKFSFIFYLFEILSDGLSTSDNLVDVFKSLSLGSKSLSSKKLTYVLWQVTDLSQVIVFFILKGVGPWLIWHGSWRGYRLSIINGNAGLWKCLRVKVIMVMNSD